jgi:hypothetical protein
MRLRVLVLAAGACLLWACDRTQGDVDAGSGSGEARASAAPSAGAATPSGSPAAVGDCVEQAQVEFGDVPLLGSVSRLPENVASRLRAEDGPCVIPPGVVDETDCGVVGPDGVWYQAFDKDVSQKWLPVTPGRPLPLGLRADHDLPGARAHLVQRGIGVDTGVEFGQPFVSVSLCEDERGFAAVFDPTGKRLLYLHLQATVV